MSVDETADEDTSIHSDLAYTRGWFWLNMLVIYHTIDRDDLQNRVEWEALNQVYYRRKGDGLNFDDDATPNKRITREFQRCMKINLGIEKPTSGVPELSSSLYWQRKPGKVLARGARFYGV